MGRVAVLALALLAGCGRAAHEDAREDDFSLFERPGRMIRLPGGNRLSLYCVGEGSPTVVLETGFGGAAYYAWHELQPLLGRHTRTCSYDRAGYGFSELGDDLPRDLEHFVADLHALLAASGEHEPYVLVGHSNGGRIVSTYAARYAGEVSGLVLLDAAVRLPVGGGEHAPAGDSTGELPPSLAEHLASIGRCLERARLAEGLLRPAPGDECIDADFLSGLPEPMAEVVTRWMSVPDYWRAYLSEAECNYGAAECGESPPIDEDAFTDIPVRVVVASVAALDDTESAPLYGLSPDDVEAIAEARRGRRIFEDRQARICAFSADCRIERIATGEHYVQNAFPGRVAAVIAELLPG